MSSYEDLMNALDKKAQGNFQRSSEVEVKRLETPSVGLTAALGGGWGMGRQSLIWGAKSATKSSFCMQQAAIAQESGLSVAYFDAEGTYDPEWSKRLGVDTDELIYTKSATVTDVVNDGVQLITAGVDVIMVDSISALMPSTYVEKDGELKDHENTGAIGGLARSLSSALPQLNYAIHKAGSKTLLLLVSQSRKANTGMHWADKPTGGQSVPFYSSQVVKFFSSNSQGNTITARVKTGNKMIEKSVGRQVWYEVEYNKIGVQGGKGSYDFYYHGDNVGIDRDGELINQAVLSGVVQQAGSWFKYNDEVIGQGLDAAKATLVKDGDLFAEIKRQLQ